jgi:hypothetical protein
MASLFSASCLFALEIETQDNEVFALKGLAVLGAWSTGWWQPVTDVLLSNKIFGNPAYCLAGFPLCCF